MVGLNVQEPETTCDDPNCPFHGTLPVRGQVLEGVVVSNKAERTITVERSYYKFIKKYERYEKRKSSGPAAYWRIPLAVFGSGFGI